MYYNMFMVTFKYNCNTDQFGISALSYDGYKISFYKVASLAN